MKIDENEMGKKYIWDNTRITTPNKSLNNTDNKMKS